MRNTTKINQRMYYEKKKADVRNGTQEKRKKSWRVDYSIGI